MLGKADRVNMEIRWASHQLSPQMHGKDGPKNVLIPYMTNIKELTRRDRLYRLQPEHAPVVPPLD